MPTFTCLAIKLTLGLDTNEGNIGDEPITLGKTHDHRIGHLVIGTIPENAVGIMDKMCKRNTLFIVRVKHHMKLQPDNLDIRLIQSFNEEGNTE
jgi:hypothetical protein